MQILTKAIKEKLIANHKEQDGTKEFKAVLKLFNPTGIGMLQDWKTHRKGLDFFIKYFPKQYMVLLD
jgi:hypothetical protein